jgi:hypothetical protein
MKRGLPSDRRAFPTLVSVALDHAFAHMGAIRPLAVRPLGDPERWPNPWGFCRSGAAIFSPRHRKDRHCERSEAIQATCSGHGLLRRYAPRNDDIGDGASSAQAASRPSSRAAPHPSSRAAPHPSPRAVPHPSPRAVPHPSPRAVPHPSPRAAPHPSPRAVPHPSLRAEGEAIQATCTGHGLLRPAAPLRASRPEGCAPRNDDGGSRGGGGRRAPDHPATEP